MHWPDLCFLLCTFDFYMHGPTWCLSVSQAPITLQRVTQDLVSPNDKPEVDTESPSKKRQGNLNGSKQ